ncbi:insertion sequence transposase protein (plasmid) [Frigidibacter mobilis]|uniref:Insertion sequence transposase protein n=1 Tax=Frigidibacter mobilis TaxID=1335048 RepID=A0A165SXY7_9RHOB|nr:insertion sequence transposase protein [Frigidibacter mobilis]
MPIINHMKAHLRGADRIFVDETRAPVLDPGRKATKSGFFWAVVSDDRGHGGADPPIVLFHYAPAGQRTSAEVPRRIPRPVPAMRRLPVLQRADGNRA